ncbi:Peptide deformylase [Poriferisphaera corsica]|uniref:Peptide deformylase n=1 Tax=Poriferisphaera corsica TaxID=2528020 RepID=A0A517YUN8_9BACT|nr:peptide deformylase [Poriferisphaera corsica]QDU33938.1 Peptide deformylase [Poriferisphaera corsica]
MSVEASKLKIVNYPASVLRKKAKPVEMIDDEVKEVAKRMIELMHENRGVGLAAPQVGLDWRLFVCNPTAEPGDDMVFINPVISDATKEMEWMDEGCLSLPEIRGEVNRPIGVTITALDEHGNEFALQSDDFPARVWQHENDHLDGVLIIDKMKMMDKMANRKLIKELESIDR